MKSFTCLLASLVVYIFSFAHSVVAQPIAAPSAEAESVAAELSSESSESALKLSALLSAMDTLDAQFQQTIVDNKGVELQKVQGYLKVKKPENFYWRTEEPYEQLLVTQGDILWLYDLDLEQISKQTLSDDLSQTPALLLGGDVKKIHQQYSITQQENNEGLLLFMLKPKSSDSIFSNLAISFKQENIYSMVFSDHFNQLTTIVFADVKINRDIDLSLFEFTPPVGVDVIDNSSEPL